MGDTADASLRRGSAEVLVLSMIEERARHGYEIARLIADQSHGAVRFHVASFYPLLYQMERRRLIKGQWIEKAGQRRRRYYGITAAGRQALAHQRSRWETFIAAMTQMARLRRA
jgi:DNA-binding PadR family transcriptional regulator